MYKEYTVPASAIFAGTAYVVRGTFHLMASQATKIITLQVVRCIFDVKHTQV